MTLQPKIIIPVIAIVAVSLAFYWMGRSDKKHTITEANTTPEPVSVLQRPARPRGRLFGQFASADPPDPATGLTVIRAQYDDRTQFGNEVIPEVRADGWVRPGVAREAVSLGRGSSTAQRAGLRLPTAGDGSVNDGVIGLSVQHLLTRAGQGGVADDSPTQRLPYAYGKR